MTFIIYRARVQRHSGRRGRVWNEVYKVASSAEWDTWHIEKSRFISEWPTREEAYAECERLLTVERILES